jgi:hypothetical protein
MNSIDRRRLLKLAGAGSAVAATAALPMVGQVSQPAQTPPQAGPQQPALFGFRATLGLPQSPLPNYATYVVEGSLDLLNGTGLITSRVLAGHPGDPSEIGLPGMARIIKVTQVESNGTQVDLRGVIEDRGQLQPGESPEVQMSIDRTQGTVLAPFGGRMVSLALT